MARARREVFRAEKALAACIAREHESTAKLYQHKASTGEGKVHDMEMNVGSMLATMKRCGMVDFAVPTGQTPSPDSLYEYDGASVFRTFSLQCLSYSRYTVERVETVSGPGRFNLCIRLD